MRRSETPPREIFRASDFPENSRPALGPVVRWVLMAGRGVLSAADSLRASALLEFVISDRTALGSYSLASTAEHRAHVLTDS
jgi:hypothetical protein